MKALAQLASFSARRLLPHANASPAYTGSPSRDPEQTRPGNDLPYEPRHTAFDNKIVLITAALLLVLIAAVFINFLIRWTLRRWSARMQPPAEDVAAPPPLKAKPAGMKKSQLKALPTLIFRSSCSIAHRVLPESTETQLHLEAQLPTQCPICLAEFSDGDKIRVLPNCHHGFHVACVDPWLYRQSSCPTCRADPLAAMIAEKRSRGVEIHIVITSKGELSPSLCGEPKAP